MHCRFREHDGIFMKGKQVVYLYIALLCIISVQLVGNWQCWLCTLG